ncbi:hypothetical protein GCM10008986_00730 [Salinibacillus aidingensis]|uniref:Uncharacterized protein n=1 Tax=Salinibacillus aidingensis TaxID=237684 RepID=A0ABN1AMF5_9BACI
MKKWLMTLGLITGIMINPELASAKEDDQPKGITHDWEKVHTYSKEHLVDSFQKKVQTFVSYHYHDYHVYRTITVHTYRCTLHGEYKTKTHLSDKRVEKQPH